MEPTTSASDLSLRLPSGLPPHSKERRGRGCRRPLLGLKSVCTCDYFFAGNLLWILCQVFYVALVATAGSEFQVEHKPLVDMAYILLAWLLFIDGLIYVINWEDEAPFPDFYVISSDWLNTVSLLFYCASAVLYIDATPEDPSVITIAALEFTATLIMLVSALCAVRSWSGGWARGGWLNVPPGTYRAWADPELFATTIFLAAAVLDVLNSSCQLASQLGATPLCFGGSDSESNTQSPMDVWVTSLYLLDGLCYMWWWKVESAMEARQAEEAMVARAARKAAAAAAAASQGKGVALKEEEKAEEAGELREVAKEAMGEMGLGDGRNNGGVEGDEEEEGEEEEEEGSGYDVVQAAALFCCTCNRRHLGLVDFYSKDE